MASRLRRARFVRTAVATAVVAIPLLATGSAQAAIAGGNPATTSATPDLRSATILNQTDVEVCFNKAIASPSNFAANSGLGGYRAGRFLAPASAQPESGKTGCVIATFPQPPASQNRQDLGQYTVYEVSGGAVTTASGGQGNLPDSVTLGGPSNSSDASLNGTHNGTTGLTTGPDLVGASVPPSSVGAPPNSLVYTFDQNIDTVTNPPVVTNFWIADASGNQCRAAAIVGVGDTSIIVHFPTGGATPSECNIANTHRDGVDTGGVHAAADPHSPNPTDGQGYSGASTGGTTLPDLVKANLGSSADTVDFVFDKPVTSSSVDETQFQVWLSNTRFLTGTAGSGTIGSTNGGTNNTVTVTFANLHDVNEYAVVAAVTGTAAGTTGGPTGANGSGGTNTNVPGSAPIGDNAGAFARGFTTGPDAFATTINKNNGVVTISFDQRAVYTGGPIFLVDPSGNTTSFFPTSVSPNSLNGNPGPETFSLQFNAAQVSNASAVLIPADTFQNPVLPTQTVDGGAPVGADGENIDQVIAPVGSGAHLKAIARTHKAKHHKKHKRNHKRH